MGDFQALLPHQNGFLADYNPLNFPLAPRLNPLHSEINEESWMLAEKATKGVIENIQATMVSEKRRHEVVEYVQNLIKYKLNCEVFPFGSVPLKTYLPDGDIDLTAFGMPNSEDALASSVRHVLEVEEQKNDVEFEVKDVQYIHAEVKLVKCLVENIVVDISFNRSGGLSTLCFLEQVDRHIGKDHLFKRSIILIKAWCYYESRILGAHHALISTYALEMLVLYIFHLFHLSLDGPLAVLYRFLDYYSKFDWDNYCISLHGPVLLSSLPEFVAEAPENDEGDLLFTKEYLKNCVDNFSVLPRGFDSTSRTFPRKHLNIVDPLKENNNLGRSVSKGNFCRIRSAFTYGARKLGQILLQPSENIEAEVNMFFANTIDRHGSDERPEVQDATDDNEELCEEINTIRLSSSENQNIIEKSEVSMLTSESNNSSNGKVCYIPHLFFQSEGNQNGRSNRANPSNVVTDKFVSDSSEAESLMSNTSWSSTNGSEKLENSNPGDSSSKGAERNGASGRSKSVKLADLTGDYDVHIRNLLYVQWTHEYIQGSLYPFYPQSPYQNQNQKSWDHSWRHGAFSHMNANGRVPGSGTYPINPPFISGSHGMEDFPKPRGTGTYFPNTNYHAYKERHSPGKGKNPVPTNHLSRYRNNGRPESPEDVNFEEKYSREPPPLLRLPGFSGNGLTSAHPVFPPERELEFGSFGPVTLGSPSQEPWRRSDSFSPRKQGSGLTMPTSTLQRPSVSSSRERSAQAYQLKDEDDFPPLTG